MISPARGGQECGELRSFVLDLVPAVQELRLHVQRRTAPIGTDRNAQTRRRVGCRRGIEGRQRRQHRVAVAAQGVHPDIEGPPRQCLQLRDEVVAERGRKIRKHEGRGVARDFGRSVVQRPTVEARALVVAEGCGRETLPGEQRRHRSGGEALLESQRADQDGARRLRAHDPGRRSPAPQSIVDEAGDARTVTRTGETMGEAPVLEGVGGRPATLGDIGQDFDGGGAASGGSQGSDPPE